MIRDVMFCTAVAAALAVTAWWAGPAFSHMTASGWAYDPVCRSGQDCAPVKPSRVTATPAGWLVQIEPGDHPLARCSISAVIPFDSPKVRHSQDGDFHACIGAASNTLFCIYVPDMLG